MTGSGTTYNVVVDVSDLDGTDIRVTGPGGYDQLASFVEVDQGTDGTPRVATYEIPAPGGNWGLEDDGEPGLENWHIYVDLNKNCQWDPGEPDDWTDEEGNYVISGLAVVRFVIVSPDGSHVYVAAQNDAAVTVFNRNPVTGRLTLVEVLRDGQSSRLPRLRGRPCR